LPFWLEALDADPAVVLVHRHPLEIWRSLDARDGFSKELALALWERYLRSALASARGLPALVIRYSDVLASPGAWVEQARAFLGELGMDSTEATASQVDEFLDSSLRHAAADQPGALAASDASEEQRRLFEVIEDLVGEHEALDPAEIPAETPWTEALLAERRRADLEMEPLRLRSKRLDIDLRVARRRVERLRVRLGERERTIESRRRAVAEGRRKVADMERSLSWRVTAPLRRLAARLGRRG
jgi:hypothetical protein